MKKQLFMLFAIIVLAKMTYSGEKESQGIGYGKGNANPESKAIIDSWIDSIAVKDSIRIEKCKENPDSTCKNGLRNKAEIIKTVMANLEPLRQKYNGLLKKNPNIKGKIVVTFHVAYTGDVVFSQLKESTIPDTSFEKFVVDNISKWKFEEIDVVGDTTVVNYPFAFSK